MRARFESTASQSSESVRRTFRVDRLAAERLDVIFVIVLVVVVVAIVVVVVIVVVVIITIVLIIIIISIILSNFGSIGVRTLMMGVRTLQ